MHNQDHEHNHENCHEHNHEHCHEHEHNCSDTHNHMQHAHIHEAGCACSECTSDSKIKIILHEGAVSASFNTETLLSEEAAGAVVSENMVKLAGWINENHGLIGHIKAAVTGGAGVKMYSITKSTVNVKNNGIDLKTPLDISFTAILFNTEPEILKQKLLEIYNVFI